MSNLSSSHSVFYPFWELSVIFIKFEIVVCKLFQVVRVKKKMSFGKRIKADFGLPCWSTSQSIDSRSDWTFCAVWSWIYAIHKGYTTRHWQWKSKPIPTQWHLLTPLGNKPSENTVGKGEIARNEQFLLFPQCFLPVWIALCHFLSNLKLSSANSFSLEESKIYRLVMG